MRITAYYATDVGRHREINEDNVFSGSTVHAVVDGMGGHVAGEVASETALRPVSELDGREFDDAKSATEALRDAIVAANQNVLSEARADPNLAGMGTTLTAVMLRDDNLYLAHVGDSRAYLLRNGEEITQLTTDHTLVEQLVQDGRLSRDEVSRHPQRSVVTRAIGVENDVEVDTFPPIVLQPGDQILLCSDGLTGPVSDEQIADLLISESDGEAAVRGLIGAANDAGGPDNITVVLLRVEDDGSALVPAEAEEEDDEDDDEAALVEVHEPPRSIPIRTRPESENHDWAKDMMRYGDRQGVDSGTGLDHRGRSRGRRVFGVLTGVIVILGILAAGGYLLLTRAFFIGPTPDGSVAVYRGLNESIAGIALYTEVSEAEIELTSLPAFQQQRIREGITVGTTAEAEAILEGYRAQLEEAEIEGRRNQQDDTSAEPTPAP